jgi:SAM-dependent methyltransferase
LLGSAPAPNRESLAGYLRGSGIEVGALHNPLPVDKQLCEVKYVDRFTEEELRRIYPELADQKIVPVSIIGSAERLDALGDASQDFVIANHLIEHVEDPIGAIREWHRVLRPGGVLFLAVPHGPTTFDMDRRKTSIAHLLMDHLDRGASARFEHYKDWTERVDGVTGGANKSNRINELLAKSYPIHFHVWTESSFFRFWSFVRVLFRLRFKLVAHVRQRNQANEFVYLFKKC